MRGLNRQVLALPFIEVLVFISKRVVESLDFLGEENKSVFELLVATIEVSESDFEHGVFVSPIVILSLNLDDGVVQSLDFTAKKSDSVFVFNNLWFVGLVLLNERFELSDFASEFIDFLLLASEGAIESLNLLTHQGDSFLILRNL